MVESKIEWTGRSDWNPVRGCTRVSPGCGGPGPHGGCYAEKIASRFSGPGLAFHGFAERIGGNPHWTGKVEVMWDRLTDPLKWREPATIFALSMSDLFHENLPTYEIATIYAVMVAAVHVRRHAFQVLTKRSDRMREILNSEAFWRQVNHEASHHVAAHIDAHTSGAQDEYGHDNPPPGIWLGVSVENQKYADERIPDLLATPAVIRFLSCEPLLESIDLFKAACPYTRGLTFNALSSKEGIGLETGIGVNRIDWVIAGGESGPNARPPHPEWFRSLRDQCAAAGVPFFFKQWGEWADMWGAQIDGDGPVTTASGDVPDWMNRMVQFSSGVSKMVRAHSWTGHGTELMYRVGKKAAGAMLDGVEHKATP